jgi:hypothetical protein
MRNPYLTLNLGLFAQYQGARLIIGCRYIATHTPVYAQTAAEGNIPFDDRAGPDQAVYAILRFGGLAPNISILRSRQVHGLRRHRSGIAGLQHAHLHLFDHSAGGIRNVPSTRW